MNTAINITTLGHLQVQRGEQIINNFISTKAVLLLVYLAMHPGDHTRKKLAAMFWSETSDRQALKNLRTILSSVRQNIPDALIVERDVLAINPEAHIRVDASAFEVGCTTVFSSPDQPDLLTTMQDLAAWYRGSFLADVAFREAVELDNWITEKQRQLYDLYSKLLYKIAEVALQQTDYEVGLYYVKQLVNLDPLWDAAQRQLMRLLAYTDHTNDALIQYEKFAQILSEELGAVPEQETMDLYEQIRSRKMVAPASGSRSSIVLPDMPFVESVEDLALAQRMLNTPQCRLLTLYGISGIGKTALATQIAFHREHLYPDGAYLISLKGAQSARDLPHLVAGTLGIDYSSQTGYRELEGIVIDYLKGRNLLLVLDNYEHLLPETAFIEKILEHVTRVQLIITSQSPLNLFREWVIPLSGLRVPHPEDPHPETFESVRLFELAAQRINPRFSLQNELTGVGEICRLVDGLPLAIVIAAGWTQIIPINKIIDYIIEGQEFILPFQQTLAPHHQSLEMMLEYTWNTLAQKEQYALVALSIFNNSFDFDEAHQICEVDVEMLALMVQRSLIQKYNDKYRMHQLIWRYARKKLIYSEQKEALSLRYRDYTTLKLGELQRYHPMIHEYLLAIEMEYASIWNYDWMPKSSQPVYLLAISQFLTAYWQVSRPDAIPMICQMLESIDQTRLVKQQLVLLKIQLARLYAIVGNKHQAKQFIVMAMQHNAVNTHWHHIGMMFTLYNSLMDLPASPDLPNGSPMDDITIIRTAQLKLTSLYMDMRDYQAAEELFTYLLDDVVHPINRAMIFGVRGTIAAETGDFQRSFRHFEEALRWIADTDSPLLKLSFYTLTMRVANHLNRDDATCQYLCAALTQAAAIKDAAVMLELLTFCTELAFAVQDRAINQYVNEAIEYLRVQPSGEHVLETLRKVTGRIAAMCAAYKPCYEV